MQLVPSPPTDNLYKFVAISGVVLVAAAFIGPIRAADDTASEISHATDSASDLADWQAMYSGLGAVGLVVGVALGVWGLECGF